MVYLKNVRYFENNEHDLVLHESHCAYLHWMANMWVITI